MQTSDSNVAYALGRLETWLEEFAKQKQLHLGEFKAEVVKLLLNGEAPERASRPTHRGPYRKTLSQRTKELNKRGLNAHGRPLSAGVRGWGSMTKEERSAEMRHRQAVSRGEEPPRKRASQPKQPMGGGA